MSSAAVCSFRSSRVPLVIWLALVGITSSDARASNAGPTPRRHDSLENWAIGLDPQSADKDPRDVILLRAPGEARVHFAGGTFLMGSTDAELEKALDLCRREIEAPLCEKYVPALLYEKDAHQVTLGPFAIDRTEVSVGAYGKCVAAGACLRAQFPLGDPRFDRPDFPVTYVTWDDAHAFCAFAGGRLPTEAEWEFVARGENRRIFPWGDVYNPHLANHGALYGSQTTDATDGYTFVAPVDAFFDGATPEGVLQMAGNVSEWVADFFSPDLFSRDSANFGYADDAVTNPTGPPSGIVHLVRGGSYAHGAAFLRGAARNEEWTYSPDVGFRCAYAR